MATEEKQCYYTFADLNLSYICIVDSVYKKLWRYYLNYTSTKSIPASSRRHFKCFVNLSPWQQCRLI